VRQLTHFFALLLWGAAALAAVISLRQPADFGAVGRFYLDFRPVTDKQGLAILDRATATGGDPPGADDDVRQS